MVNSARSRFAACLGALSGLVAPPLAADPGETRAAEEREALERRLEAVEERNRQLEETVRALEERVPDGASEPASRESPDAPAAASATREPDLWSHQLGGANLQLLDISVDVLAAVGASTARDDTIELLQGGDHDPRQRGFTLQAIELGFAGAVDPYVSGEVHLVYFLDPDGESRFEVEEAFLQSIALPFGLDELGLQVEAGTFFTEFGRSNPRHAHAWDWLDQPLVLSRFFGGDGLRGPGARLGWLLPLPWTVELHGGVQNADGETMVSFLANDEVFDERPIGGRPFADRRVRTLGDLTYLARLVNGVELSDAWSAQLGASALFGPNGTGNSGRTEILGADLILKWVPLDAHRGWPFVKLEGEVLYRRYRADSFFGCFEPAPGCTEVFVDSKTLRDHGFYLQALVGFLRGWSAGLRYERASGQGSNVAFDAATGGVIEPSRSLDPFRSPRHRISPLLIFHPSEFARFRLQYNYDHLTFSRDHDVHSVWFGIEFLFGAHPAHSL